MRLLGFQASGLLYIPDAIVQQVFMVCVYSCSEMLLAEMYFICSSFRQIHHISISDLMMLSTSKFSSQGHFFKILYSFYFPDQSSIVPRCFFPKCQWISFEAQLSLWPSILFMHCFWFLLWFDRSILSMLVFKSPDHPQTSHFHSHHRTAINFPSCLQKAEEPWYFRTESTFSRLSSLTVWALHRSLRKKI